MLPPERSAGWSIAGSALQPSSSGPGAQRSGEPVVAAHPNALLSGQPIVELRDVTFRYAGSPVPALQDVTLSIMPGELCLVLGPTGGGKSTFTQLLGGAIPHIESGELHGEIVVSGMNTRDVPMHQLATVVGAVFQEPEAQLVNIFVRDELYFGPENLCREPAAIREKAARALELVDMRGYADSEIFELSGGQKQKVSLAAVLTMEPQVLVLDQPTANLDPVSTRETFHLIRQLRDTLGITVIIVEHNIDQLAPLVDRVIVFDGGRLVANDEPRTIFYRHFQGGGDRLGLWTPQAVDVARLLEGRVEFAVPPLTSAELEAPLRRQLDQDAARFAPQRREQQAPTRAASPIIEVRGLTYRYATNGVQALTGIDLAIEPGEFVAIIGRNGSGKSSLAKLLTKILEPEPGTVWVDGQDVNELSLFQLTDTLGYVFQNPDHQFVTDTVNDEIAYSLRVRRVAADEIERRVEELLELFGLREARGASPFSLSVGERRLLSVATMLVLDQRVVILDEPTIGQDQASAHALMSHLRRLNETGRTIVVITHDMRLLAEWASRAVVFSRSRLVFDGSIADIFSQPDLLDEAALIVPPVVELAQRLAPGSSISGNPILTPADFAAAWRAPAAQREAAT